MPAIILFLALVVSGAGLIVGGIYILFDIGPSMLAAGLLLFVAALVLRKGMTVNG